MQDNAVRATEPVGSTPEVSPSQGITLILPAKNEADGIAEVVALARPYVNEIIVVDGHSTDGTFARAQAAGADQVILDDRTGKGGAYKVGVRAAKYENVIFMDADGSHDPQVIPAMAAPMIEGRSDMVIGSRIKGGSDELHGDFDHFVRAIGSGMITASINWRWNAGITDALNGFRGVRKSVFLNLQLKCNDFDIEQHMIAQTLRQGYRVSEVPAHEHSRKWGKSKLPTYRKGYLFLWRLVCDLM